MKVTYKYLEGLNEVHTYTYYFVNQISYDPVYTLLDLGEEKIELKSAMILDMKTEPDPETIIL